MKAKRILKKTQSIFTILLGSGSRYVMRKFHNVELCEIIVKVKISIILFSCVNKSTF